MKVFLIIIFVILFLILAFSIIATCVFYDYSVRRKEPIKNYIPKPNTHHAEVFPIRKIGREWISKQKIIEESIISFDDLKLVADIIESKKKSDKVVIMMHGFRAQDYDDFALSIKYFGKENYNIILPYQRAHGKSEGKHLTFGIKERFDCRDWIDFAIKRYGKDCQIVLSGVSMGCATVLMTLGFELPKNVKFCIADCGYTKPRSIFADVLKRKYHLPAFPIINFCKIFAKVFANFDMDAYSVEKALEKNKIPVLFIHGDKDNFVPEYMSHENYKACKAEKELLIVPNAEHAVAFLRETDLCWNKIKEKLNLYVK